MDNRSNTIAGWVLGAAVVLLGTTLVTGEVFKSHRPDVMGYPIEGVELETDGAEAEPPIAFFMQTADAGRGEQAYRRCAACHTINQGGANGLGPNLWGNMGADIAHVPGFNYSPALQAVAGSWNWDNMSEWLRSPRQFAPGTRMTFAGIGDAQERADLMLYMNTMSSNPIPLPPPPAEPEASPEQEAADAAMEGAETADDQPVLEIDEVTQGGGSVGGVALDNRSAD